ncbi:MAG: CoA pyrophosphatase [Flavobacteriales bacterium]|nr:CoA pyrophosphatase [Flavobacteriales bacterium]
MTITAIRDRLQQRLREPLPGHDAFLELSGYKREDLEAARRISPPPRESAVLALIYERQAVPHLLLMLRPTYEGVHSGQVAFPGGRMEPEDADLRSTALREFSEETGAAVNGVEVLGMLTPVYIPPSRSLVTPFIGMLPELGAVAPDPREVAALIEAPLELVLRDDILKHRQQHLVMLGRSVQVPYFDIEGHAVWGATAMMMAELRELLRPHFQSKAFQ